MKFRKKELLFYCVICTFLYKLVTDLLSLAHVYHTHFSF